MRLGRGLAVLMFHVLRGKIQKFTAKEESHIEV